MNDQPAAGAPADDTETPGANLAAILRLAQDGQYENLMASESSRRKYMYELLANSDDPMWAEIGAQLRDGQMGLRDIWSVEAYSTHIIDTIDKHGGDFAAALAKTREELEAEQDTRQGPR